MAESTSFMSPVSLLILGVGALVLAGGLFALIYWLMGRGQDDESQ